MPQAAPVIVTKDWTPPTAPEPKEARRLALMEAHEALCAAHVTLSRAARLDAADDHERAFAELTKAFKAVAAVRETMRALVEDVG